MNCQDSSKGDIAGRVGRRWLSKNVPRSVDEMYTQFSDDQKMKEGRRKGGRNICTACACACASEPYGRDSPSKKLPALPPKKAASSTESVRVSSSLSLSPFIAKKGERALCQVMARVTTQELTWAKRKSCQIATWFGCALRWTRG